MLDQITATFPQTLEKGCLQTLTQTEFCIFDAADKRCYIQTDPSGTRHFTVENPSERPIHFLAIDKCLFMDDQKGLKRCDFAVFDAKTFCFVEIKETESATQRSVLTRDAKTQLKATIELFRDRMTFTTRFVEAHLCVGDYSTRPARLTNDLNEQIEFAELGAKLYRGNSKRFA
ncbi:MAG: hypothetical protein EAZ91_17805 [Cytophagales bacterium]|nr:MAG: hypothetical protein EAZ91_17805 [Cytophagales bacterium]